MTGHRVSKMIDHRFIEEAETFGYPLKVEHYDGGFTLLNYGQYQPAFLFSADADVVVALPEVYGGSELARVIEALPGLSKCEYEPLRGYSIAIWPHNIETLICLATGMMVYGEQYPGQWDDIDNPLFDNTIH